MGYDPFSPVSPAQINVLCLPASRISKDEFEQCVSKLRTCSVVRLKHAPSGSGNNGRCMDFSTTQILTGGLADPTGESWVLLNISAYTRDIKCSELYPFEPNRRAQIIIGVISSRDISDPEGKPTTSYLEETISTFNHHVKSYEYSITSTVIIFGAETKIKIPNCLSMSDKSDQSSLHHLMTDVVAEFHNGLAALMEKLRRDWPDFQSTAVDPQRAGNQLNRTESPSKSEPRSRDAAQVANSTSARQNIVFGLLHLQAGQWSNATRLLSDGAAGARSTGDSIWQAKALEGLLSCMLISMWAHVEFTVPQMCYPSNDKYSQVNYSQSLNAILSSNRPNSISLFGSTSTSPENALTELTPHLTSTIIGLYERSLNSIDNSQPLILLGEARIRWLNLLALIKVNDSSLLGVTLHEIVGDKPGDKQRKEQKQSGTKLVLSKTLLAQSLIDVSLEAQQKLEIEEAASIQLAIARSFSLLKIGRKHGFHLKQFLQRLAPALVEARRRAAAELGIHPSANIRQLTNNVHIDGDSDQQAISELLIQVAEVYGLPISQSQPEFHSISPQDRLSKALRFWTITHGSGDLLVKLEILSMCIETADALQDFRSSLDFTSYLLQASKTVVTVTASTSKHSPLIESADLSRLLRNIRVLLNAAEQSGSSKLRAEYWDKFLVRDVNLIANYGSNKLMQHAAYDLSLAAGADSEAKRDPFIFNPFAKPKLPKGEFVATVGDVLDFGVILQNPLDVEIEIENIILLGEGCDFSPSSHSIVLGPLCSQAFILQGSARSTGQLTISGTRATIRGCYTEDFLIFPGDWRPSYSIKQQTKPAAHVHVTDIHLPTNKELIIKIIKPLPTLSIASSSLAQTSLMLLEGETTEIELNLQNDSLMDIDFVTLTFDNSVTRALEEALANKDLNSAETYEVQYQMIHGPAVTWLNENVDLCIPAGTQTKFQLKVFGRPGLSHIHVLVDYACLGKPRSEINETFYTRQLVYSVATTINGSISIPRCSLMPFEDDLHWTLSDRVGNLKITTESNAHGQKPSQYGDRCMLVLDMRNLWPHPLEIDVTASEHATSTTLKNQEARNVYEVSELILPGQVNRVMLLIPRIFVLDARAVIPNLDSKRQFVVSATKMSIEAEFAGREAFWYRERLLQCLKVTWKEQFGMRQGELDMRKGIRLNARMIDALRVDQVELSFALRADFDFADNDDGIADDPVRNIRNSHYALRRNRFATLVTYVHNRGNLNLELLLRLQPSLRNQPHNVALELSKRFVWSGSLQQALHPPLRSGEIRQIELGIVVLAAGQYEVSGLIEEIRRNPTIPGEEASTPEMSQERRIWYARRPCLIDVDDT